MGGRHRALHFVYFYDVLLFVITKLLNQRLPAMSSGPPVNKLKHQIIIDPQKTQINFNPPTD